MNIVQNIIKLIFGDKSSKDIKALQPYLDKINQIAPSIKNLTHEELRDKTFQFRELIKSRTEPIENEIKALEEQADSPEVSVLEKENLYKQADELKDKVYKTTEDTLLEILPEAFLVVRETAARFTENKEIRLIANSYDREFSALKNNVRIEGEYAVWKNSWDAAGKEVTWDMVHYDVQLLGGIVLHQGKIAEMATGEGKTLVATLPIYLNALPGKGLHVVTVNNYLARRDAAWMAPIFQFHGLSIDCIDNHQPNSPERRKAYLADITYGTNSEFGFDYLRDNGANSAEELVQRTHNYAIVDEVDSVLIDDARTPLIISGPMAGGENHEFLELKPKIERLVKLQKELLNRVLADAKKLIKEGDEKEGGFLLLRVYRGLPKNSALIKFLSEEGVKQLLLKTESSYMQDNNREMPKVDAELYFTIEEKHNSIQLTEKGIEELSKDTSNDFFILPDIGAQMVEAEHKTSDEKEKIKLKEEVYRDYAIKSKRIHTMNQLLKAYTLFEKDVEYVIMDSQIKIVDEQTGRIMEGRRYSDGLHQAIEAKENVKIENATQTYASITLQNYFRMYKKLAGMTGTAITEANEFWQIYKLDVVEVPTNKPITRQDYEDLLYKTKREKFNAIIDEIVRLSENGRPVLVGTTSVEVSELLSRMLTLRKIKHNVLNAKMHTKEAEIIAEAGRSGIVTIATNMAGRGTDIKLTEDVKQAGGLAIIGTERHDSRRVDRQLRGRAGRQGDVGSSQFYISLEDNLMRLFASERIAKIMDFLGLKEGDVIQDKRITNMVEKAQKRVEENHFGSRKHTLEYDNVMNSQREVIYRRRNHALFGDRLGLDIANMISDTAFVMAEENKAVNDYSNFSIEVISTFGINNPISEQDFQSKSINEIADKLFDSAYLFLNKKSEMIAESTYPIIKNIIEKNGKRFKFIAVPFTDGIKTINISADLEKSYNTKGKQLVSDYQKNIVLAVTDAAWKEHLRDMDDLKESVRNAVYEQKDPVLIYKFEAFNLFQDMIKRVNKDIVSFLFQSNLASAQNHDNIQEASKNKRSSSTKEGRGDLENDNSAIQNFNQNTTEKPKTFVRDAPKLGRNDKVTIQNIKNGEKKQCKFKQAESLIQSGEWVLV